MKNKIRRYHPQFVADLRIATSYYDDISINLGNRLRATIQKHLELISDSPVGLGLVFVTRAQRVITAWSAVFKNKRPHPKPRTFMDSYSRLK